MIAVVQRTLMRYRVAPLQLLGKKLHMNVCVYCAALGEGVSTSTLPDEVKVVLLPRGRVVIPWGEKRYELPLLRGLCAALDRDEPEVVLAEGPTNILGNVGLYRWAHTRGRPIIWWDAGRRRGSRRNPLRRLADPLIRLFIKRSAASVAYGSIARDYLVGMGASPESVFVAQNALSAPSIEPAGPFKDKIRELRRTLSPTGEKVLLYVGCLERRKRVDVLLRAADRLKHSNVDLRICIVGDGPAKAELQSLAATLLKKNCYFAGQIYNGVEAYFAAADIFVLPAEGGLAINQAMACGLPVVAGSADGTEIDLIRDGENGFLFPDGDLETLSRHIQRLATDDGLRRRIGDANRAKAREKLSMEEMVNGIARAVRCATQVDEFASGSH